MSFLLKVDPFNQPNVTEAKEKTRSKINISRPILPMQPEGEPAPSKPTAPKRKYQNLQVVRQKQLEKVM